MLSGIERTQNASAERTADALELSQVPLVPRLHERVPGDVFMPGAVGTHPHESPIPATSMPVVHNFSLGLTEDGAVLLDLEHDRLLKLNQVGLEMWRLISTSKPQSEIVAILANRYEVAPSLVAGDLRSLLDRIASLDLKPEVSSSIADDPLVGEPTVATPAFPWYFQNDTTYRPKPTFLAVIVAFAGLALFDLALFLFSMKRLCIMVRKWQRKPRPVDNGADVIGKVCSAVEIACVWYPKPALCLQRSAVTACMLKSRGLPARMIVGIRSLPFMAHAWVELDGQVVNDWPRVGTFYKSVTAY